MAIAVAVSPLCLTFTAALRTVALFSYPVTFFGSQWVFLPFNGLRLPHTSHFKVSLFPSLTTVLLFSLFIPHHPPDNNTFAFGNYLLQYQPLFVNSFYIRMGPTFRWNALYPSYLA